jgi:ribosomal protein S14
MKFGLALLPQDGQARMGNAIRNQNLKTTRPHGRGRAYPQLWLSRLSLRQAAVAVGCPPVDGIQNDGSDIYSSSMIEIFPSRSAMA